MNRLFQIGLLAALLAAPAVGLAQQTFFNVPESDLTPRHKVLVQQQVDLHAEEIRGTTTFSYGLGRGWEAGLNLYNVNYLPPSGSGSARHRHAGTLRAPLAGQRAEGV